MRYYFSIFIYIKIGNKEIKVAGNINTFARFSGRKFLGIISSETSSVNTGDNIVEERKEV